MIAIVGGLGAALCFATSTLCATRASREIGVASTFAWMAIIGLVLCAPLIVQANTAPSSAQLAWLSVAGVTNALGLMLEYTGLRVGQVGVVAPIVSTEGAITALIAVLAGESLSPLAGVALLVVAVGVCLVALPSEPSADEPGPARAVRSGSLFGAAAALCFGISLYATGHMTGLAIGWVVVPTRFVGAVGVLLPLAILGRLRLTRGCAPFVALAGTVETLGFVLYIPSLRAMGSRSPPCSSRCSPRSLRSARGRCSQSDWVR
jgi:drug/metabolite transporter (DMT)-like permease